VSDWPLVAIRWALYADLGLLFGIPLFGLYAGTRGRRDERLPVSRLCAVLAACGLALSLLGFALIAADMAGTTIGQIDGATLSALLWQTSLGTAWLARMVALLVALGVSLWLPEKTRALLVICGAIAVASLAWFGHGAAGEGGRGLVHLVADILHLLAASVWVGALAMLLRLVSPRGIPTQARLATAHRALAGFGTIGAMLVGIVIATGVINSAFLIGFGAIPTLTASLYGQLLIVKLLLFAMMLCCAALNRFRLTPRLVSASGPREIAAAFSALRRTIAIEAGIALLILALVGWLGTLAPPVAAS
jgi:putative copper resistance protein D